MKSKFMAVGFLLFMLIFSHPLSTQAQEVEDERDFDYARGGTMGPDKWGAMKEEWSLCSNGTMQSPIDMSSRRVDKVVSSKKLDRNYKPCNATILNRGHDIMRMTGTLSPPHGKAHVQPSLPSPLAFPDSVERGPVISSHSVGDGLIIRNIHGARTKIVLPHHWL
ncbi:hypothetical protein M8C21_006963 [Ambrosia artemisiifolia]|uniref:Uncharacterized protein n=1 Tax=Ambrosia artemisiifolia TaxID=4212 RepID=A0AAD5BMD8_AMBAR|nr:hypothetical protein M8C21_006963 [Ambrosia artemisiifolia]